MKLELKLSLLLKSVAALTIPCGLSGQLDTFTITFILVRIICFMSGGICAVHEFLLVYLFILPDTDVTAIFCLLHYSFQ